MTTTEPPASQAPAEPKGSGRASAPKTKPDGRGKRLGAPKIPCTFKLAPDAKARLEANSFVMGVSQGDILESLIMTLPEVQLSTVGSVALGDRLAGVLWNAVHEQAVKVQLPKDHLPPVFELLALYIATNAERHPDPVMTIGLALNDPRQGRMRLRAALKSLALRGTPFPDLNFDQWALIRKVGRLAVEYTLQSFTPHP